MMDSANIPSVLIGITTSNRCDILPKAISSAMAQSYSNKRIVVIDDASSDETNALKSQFPGVEWMRNETPRGYRENRNSMMKTPGIDYYVSLDDDAWFLENDEISVAVDCMENEKSIGAIAFDILSPSNTEKKQRTASREAFCFIGCGHILRVSAVSEVGWYEDTPGPYGSEEKDLCLRLMNINYRIELLPGVHVWHDKAWEDRDWYPLHKSGVCNDLVISLKRCPLPDLILILPYKIFSHLSFGVRQRGALCPTLSGFSLFFCSIPAIFKTRSSVKRQVFWAANKR